MSTEHVWIWKQPKKAFRVIADVERGIIEVYNSRGEIVLRKENLSRRQVELVEKRFLASVATRLMERPGVKPPRQPEDPFDPMFT